MGLKMPDLVINKHEFFASVHQSLNREKNL